VNDGKPSYFIHWVIRAAIAHPTPIPIKKYNNLFDFLRICHAKAAVMRQTNASVICAPLIRCPHGPLGHCGAREQQVRPQSHWRTMAQFGVVWLINGYQHLNDGLSLDPVERAPWDNRPCLIEI
jgi:hypothetical protein